MNMKLDKDIMELGQVLDVVGEKLPNVIKSLMDSVYSEKSGCQVGKAIVSLRKELMDSGMSKEEIAPLLSAYMKSVKNVSLN